MVRGLNHEEVRTESSVETRHKLECRRTGNYTGDLTREEREGTKIKRRKGGAGRFEKYDQFKN